LAAVLLAVLMEDSAQMEATFDFQSCWIPLSVPESNAQGSQWHRLHRESEVGPPFAVFKRWGPRISRTTSPPLHLGRGRQQR